MSSVNLEQEPLEVLPLRTVERHRMIGPRGQAAYEGDAAAGIDRRRGDVDVLHRRRPPRRGVDAERSAVGEEIEHAPAADERARQRAVIALIEEESSLLPGRRIDAEAEAVLQHCRRGSTLADRFALDRQPLELARRDVVLEVDDPRRETRAKRVDNERTDALDAGV